MISPIHTPQSRKLGGLTAVIILNSFLLYHAVIEPDSLSSKATPEKPDSAQEVKKTDKAEAINIEVVQAPKQVPKHTNEQSEQVAQVTPATSQKNLVAQKQSQKNRESSVPRLVGQFDIGYLELERMVERAGGAIFLYDLNIRRPVRQIKRGVLVSLSQAPTSLSAVSHNITDELESHRVATWAEEQRLFNPNGSFVVVAKFPASFQQGFEQLAHQAAKELNIEYKSVDEVRFQFTQQGLVIQQLKVDNDFLTVNKPFSA